MSEVQEALASEAGRLAEKSTLGGAMSCAVLDVVS